MTTAQEFIQSGITGQTFREIQDKFGSPFNSLMIDDPVMGNYALGFAHFRDREHLSVPEAWERVMKLSTAAVAALFEEPTPEAKAASDFASQPPTTTP
jgi:hypothetical protein